MRPFTWQDTVQLQGSNRDYLAAADTLMQKGLGGINKALTGYQQQEGELFTEDKAKNQQAAIEALRQYKTPEELQAAIASGAVNQLLDPMGNRVDRSKVINYADARVKDLRTDITAEQTFNNLQEKAKVAPFMDKAKALYASGYVKEADDFVKANEPLFKNYQADIINFKNEAELKGLTAQDARNRAELSQATQPMKLEQAEIDTLNTKQAAKTQQDNLAAESIVNKHYSEFEKQKTATTQRIKDLAATPTFSSYPKTADGLVDVGNLTKDQAAMWAGRLKQEKIAVPDSSQPLKQIQADLTGLPAAKQKAAIESLKGMLSNKTILSAESQAQLDNATALTAAAKEDAKKNNLFYFDPQSYTEDIAPVFSKISSELQDNDQTKEAVKENISKWTTEGIEYVHPVTGKTTNVIVPANLLKTAYEVSKELNSNPFGRNRTDNRMETYIKSVLENKAYAKQRQQADEIATGKADLNLQELRNALTNKADANNPATYLEQVAQKYRGTAVPLDEESLTKFSKAEEDLKNLRTAAKLSAEEAIQNGKFKSLKGTEVNAINRTGTKSKVSEKDLDWYNKLLEKHNKR